MDNIESASFKGVYAFEHWRDGKQIDAWESSNLIPNEGLNSILGILMFTDTKINSWYIGLGSATYTASATDTAANIVGRVTEITTYTGNRPIITFAAPAAQSITNLASKATFTFNATVATVTNAFVMSAATGSVGVLLSSLAISPPKTGFASGDQLIVTFTMTAASV